MPPQTIVDPSEVTPIGSQQGEAVDPSEVSAVQPSKPASTSPAKKPDKGSVVSGFFQSALGTEPTLSKQKESTWGYYRSLYNNPGPTLESTVKAAWDQWNDLTKSVQEHENGMANVEGVSQAIPYFSRGEYGKGVAAYLAKAIPFDLGAGFESYVEGKPREAIGKGLGAAFQLMTMAKGGPLEAGERTTGAMAREVSGVGKSATEEAATTHAEKSAEAQQKFDTESAETANANRQGMAQARQAHEEKVADIDQANAQVARTHAAKVEQVKKQNAEAQSALQAGQDAEQVGKAVGNSIADSLPALADAETAKAKAAYPKVEGTTDRPSLYASLKTIEDDTLKGSGSTPTSLKRILDDLKPLEGKSSGPSVMGRHFDLSHPSDLAAYNRWKANGAFTPDEIERIEGNTGKPLTFGDLHGMYSELGRELYRGDMAGDSRAALSKARGAILDTMEKMAGADGAKTLARFRKAQRGWQILENTFHNTASARRGGSPIAAALEARDPITGQLRAGYVRSILSETKANEVARDLLRNYPETGKALTESLRLLRRSAQIVKDSPKRIKLKAEPVAPEPRPLPSSASIPRLKESPTPPDITKFDPVEWRDQQMAKWAAKQRLTVQSLRPWRAPYDIVNRVAAWLLKDPQFRRRVAEYGRR